MEPRLLGWATECCCATELKPLERIFAATDRYEARRSYWNIDGERTNTTRTTHRLVAMPPWLT